jgi:hypothetical protein
MGPFKMITFVILPQEGRGAARSVTIHPFAKATFDWGIPFTSVSVMEAILALPPAPIHTRTHTHTHTLPQIAVAEV